MQAGRLTTSKLGERELSCPAYIAWSPGHSHGLKTWEGYRVRVASVSKQLWARPCYISLSGGTGTYICSAPMVNLAGLICNRTPGPLYNRIAGCITGHPVDQPSTRCDRLRNRVQSLRQRSKTRTNFADTGSSSGACHELNGPPT